MVVVVGETVIGVPVLVPSTGVVHPASVYHFHDAPVPSKPPITLSEDDPPEQMAVGFAEAPVGAVDATANCVVEESDPVGLVTTTL